MTRAQKFQWQLEQGIADGYRRLPDRTPTAAVVDLVGALERRYEILRTSIDLVDGQWRQRVHGSGEPVRIADLPPGSDVAAAVAALAERFIAGTVRQPGRILVAFSLLRQGAARWLAIIADSTAVDRACYAILDDAITELLDRSTLDGAPTGLQPAALARWEDSPTGRAEREQARQYLRWHYATAPPALYPGRPAAAVRPGRYYRCGLTLDRADEVFAHLIDATGRLPSAVILGVFGHLMAHRASASACAVNVSMENRHSRQLRTALCGTAQRAPVALDTSGMAVDSTVIAAERALTAAYPHAGRYDPDDLVAERAAAEATRGLCLTPDLAFNFNPPPQGWTALLEAPHPDGTVLDPHDGPVDVQRTNESSYEYAASLSVRWRNAVSVRLSIHGDSDVLAAGDCADVLRGIAAGIAQFTVPTKG
jgi:hypothetical protein